MNKKKFLILIVVLATVFGIASFIGFRGLTTQESAAAQVPRNVNAGSAQEASNVVGFPVASPTYIPDGFQGNSQYMIDTVGRPDWAFKTVTRTWALKSDPSVFFILTQSPKQFDIARGEPTEIEGNAGQKSVTQGIGDQAPREALAWAQDNMFFVLTGTLRGPLDEQTMMHVVESVELP